jgi:uncharacterized protein DUF4846
LYGNISCPNLIELTYKNKDMKQNLIMIIILPFFAACQQSHNKINETVSSDSSFINRYTVINEIPLPPGFTRMSVAKKSFGEWLSALPLKRNKTVYLYNGLPKRIQTAQFAVLNISIGNEDLQQCADAIMRLRAEFFYADKKFGEISFCDNNNRCYKLGAETDRKHFDEYLKKVFAMCGTLSLQKQLKPVEHFADMKIGDVLIKGGSPGHAMLIVDMATDKDGKKIYLLAQGYIPAQDIHIVKNPMNENLSPWYELNTETIYTPEWTFENNQLRTW